MGYVSRSSLGMEIGVRFEAATVAGWGWGGVDTGVSRVMVRGEKR
jgi:hypothetical protein